jgi:hypothetical protein
VRGVFSFRPRDAGGFGGNQVSDLLQQLGLTVDELQTRVIDKICDTLLVRFENDGDDGEYPVGSPLAKKLEKRVQEIVTSAVDKFADANIRPGIEKLVETIKLQKTNAWGEKNGGTISFIEYLAQRADAYLQEQVNHDGKIPDGSFGRHGMQPRIAYLIDQHLHYRIATAAQEAMKPILDSMAQGMTDIARVKFDEASKSIKICVEAKR